MGLLDAVIDELAQEPKLWWGHSNEHGWVVLDRDDARYEGESRSRHLVRCRDWVQFEVSARDFGSPQIQLFKNFIRALPEGLAREEACRELLGFRREFLSRAASFRVTKADLERRRQETTPRTVVYFNNCRCYAHFEIYGQDAYAGELQDAFYDLNTTYHEEQLRTGELKRGQECVVATPNRRGGKVIEFAHFEFSHEKVMKDKTGEKCRVFFGKRKGEPVRLHKSDAATDPRYRRFFCGGSFQGRSVC